MHSVVSKGLVALVMGASLLAGGCATTDAQLRTQASADAAAMRADRALAAADAAQRRADEAAASAQAAQAAADRAQAAAQSNSEAIRESERVRTTRLARGERG